VQSGWTPLVVLIEGDASTVILAINSLFLFVDWNFGSILLDISFSLTFFFLKKKKKLNALEIS
jgi:hypothetical protein